MEINTELSVNDPIFFIARDRVMKNRVCEINISATELTKVQVWYKTANGFEVLEDLAAKTPEKLLAKHLSKLQTEPHQ